VQSIAQQGEPALWPCGVQHRSGVSQLCATALIRLHPTGVQAAQGVFVAAAQGVEPGLRAQCLQAQGRAVGALCGVAELPLVYRLQATHLRAQMRGEVCAIGHQ
jgi:hypothetical protein